MNQTSALYYYLDLNGSTQGPVSYPELQSLLKSGIIKPTTQICKVGETSWAPFLPENTNQGLPSHASDSTSTTTSRNPLWLPILLVAILVATLLNPLSTFLTSLTKQANWEYQSITFKAINSSPSSAAWIDLEIDELQTLGREGWEVAGMWIENETVHPNFGKSEYVAGIQPNTRPSQLVIILKRKK
jgi:hypothetical protein